MKDVFKKYKINFKERINFGQWEQPPMSAYFWAHWFDKKICRRFDININKSDIIMLNGHTLIRKSDYEKIKSVARKALDNNDKEFFVNFLREAKKIFKEQEKLQEELKNCNELNFELFQKFIKTSLKIYVPWTLSCFLGQHLGDFVIEEAEKNKYDKKRILDCLKIDSTLIIDEYEDSILIKKELAKEGFVNLSVGSLIKKLKLKPKIYNKIKEHVKKYEWVGTHHFWGEPMSFKKYLKDLANVKSVSINKKHFNLPNNLKILVRASKDQGFIRQYAAEIFDINVFMARPLLNKIAEKYNLKYEELLFLTPTEIINNYQKGTAINREVIEKRKKGHCLLLVDGKEVIVDNQEEIRELTDKFFPPVRQNELKGVTANHGCGRGKVKIFLIPENLEKMENGDVLVTSMTTPDFVPLMKKASAIVTDAGGLLSHAAIISRELKKPCIVGTKNATRVLKDGDEVEVDANKGIVKILNK